MPHQFHAVHARQAQIEQNARGHLSGDRVQRILGRLHAQGREAQGLDHPTQNGQQAGVVFHHQNAGACLDGDCGARPPGCKRSALYHRTGAGRSPTGKLVQQAQRKATALAGFAVDRDFTAEQFAQVPADGKTQPGATVLSAGGTVNLLESAEHMLDLVTGNANACVDHFKHQIIVLAARQHAHGAIVSELDCVGKQIGKNLCQALSVGGNGLCQIAAGVDGERQLLLLRLRGEDASQVGQQVVQRKGLIEQNQFAGLDLGEVQDVVDQCQQLRAAFTDHRGRFDLFGCEVVVLVLRQIF